MADLLERLQQALVSRYRIERELGRGGMATVYLADDLKHHRQVAIKVLDPEVAASIGPERFLREIETVARLAHPHILPLHDSGVVDGLFFYVMPYVEGESLRGRLAREKQMSVEDSLRITREVAEALGYAHRQGLVHRDVKPENILLEEGHAVVADFGIARAVVAAGGEKLTATGVAVGTPAYMSPEQAAGSRDLDGRSDLYSLGCVLYEMLAGVPPFAGTTAESLAHQHMNVAPRPVTELRPAVPGWVAVAVQRALAKAPADRFSPVTLFAEALAPRGATAAPASVEPPRPSHRIRRAAWLGAAVVVIAAGALFIPRPGRKASTPRPAAPLHERTAIAVLPLQNLSAEGPNAYFAGGLHDELLTQLSKVAALKVISRTSVMGYTGATKSLKQIADELGVGSIVEGSVQVVGGRLRVNVQLIDAATDEHLWAERYDRTLDDAFAVQSDVAQQVVAAVGAALAAGERHAIAEPPTANAEAYRLYLQGRDYQTRRVNSMREDLETAQQLYERALALDPDFALAHAALAEVHGSILWWGHDPSPAREARMRQEAGIALRLAPDLPQARMAMGQVYSRGDHDYRRALDAYLEALKGLPNDARAWGSVGGAHRRLGHWEQAIAAFEKAVQLDPRSGYRGSIANTRNFIRDYAGAARDYDRALGLAPDASPRDIEPGLMYVRWRGQLDSLRAAVKRVPLDRNQGFSSGVVLDLPLLERNADGLLEALRHGRARALESPNGFWPVALYEAWAHQMRDDRVRARSAFSRACATTDSAFADRPDDWRLHVTRGLALAGLGRRDEALREARWLERSNVVRGDAYAGPVASQGRAMILAQAGEAEASLDEIERLLSGPSWLSVHLLRLDPRWDPIREHPRFKALLVKYANPEPVR